jgi:hypothetical protein
MGDGGRKPREEIERIEIAEIVVGRKGRQQGDLAEPGRSVLRPYRKNGRRYVLLRFGE